MNLPVLIVLVVQIAYPTGAEKHELLRPNMESCWADAMEFMESLPQDMLERGVWAGCYLRLAGVPA
jgi:hypothetical protein